MTDISEAQLKANQENAQKGGVKTEEGKEVSKFNAVKHGILKEAISEYETGLYEERIELLKDYYEPVGAGEESLVERIALYDLRLHRITRAEKEYMRAAINPRKVKMVSPFDMDPSLEPYEKVVSQGYVPIINSEDVKRLTDIYLRYEVTLENRMYRAIHELQRLQAMRRGERVAPPMSLDINVDKPE